MVSISWVCFDCQALSRRDVLSKAQPLCAQCGEAKTSIGANVPVPKKRDAKAWDALRKWYYHEKQEFVQHFSVRKVRLIHRLERQMLGVAERPSSEEREAETRRLAASLSKARAWNVESSFRTWYLRRPDFEEHLASRKAYWIARLERELRQAEAAMGTSPWNRDRDRILERLKEVRGWNAEQSFGGGGHGRVRALADEASDRSSRSTP